MPKKKFAQNAFQLFMNDWKKQHEAALEASELSQAETEKLCKAAWKDDSDRQKHYKELASKAKEKVTLCVDIKYTSTGETYESKEAERQEIQAFIDKMILEIKTTVGDLSSLSVEALVNYSFYLIHANYYIEWTTEKKFIPCEVAIVEYSIAEGICDVLHFFPGVDTPDGNLPLGYAFEAKDKSESTHQIPPPPFEPAENDFFDLSSRVMNFLTKNGSTPIPPVYTMDDNMNCNYSKSTVCDFAELMREFSGKEMRVYRLPLLFFELYNACSKFDFGTKEPFVSDVRAEEELSVDHYLYVQGISCMFHTLLESDAHRFCSKSTVQRWAYILSKFCCREVGIKPIPGKHCPDLPSKNDSSSINRGRFGRTTSHADWSRKGSNLPSEKSMIAAKKDELFSKRAEEGETSAPLFVAGREAGVLSEIRKDPCHRFVEDAGVRLPKTRGKADLLRSRQNYVDLRGFTKDDFPSLGTAGESFSHWESREPQNLTTDDFPALGACSKKCGSKQTGRFRRN